MTRRLMGGVLAAVGFHTHKVTSFNHSHYEYRP